MAPSLTRVINAIFEMVDGTLFEHSLGLLNATISLRANRASLILVADRTMMTAPMNELLALAAVKGVPIVTVQSKESLGDAFGYSAATVISLNGGTNHIPVVVNVINEAIDAGVGDEGAPAA